MEKQEMPELRQEHHWLARLAGDWSYEHDAALEPGQPPGVVHGVERVRALGPWVTLAAEREPASEAGRSMMTLGFDPARGRVVGTFVADMLPHLWVYDGAFDATGRTITLDTEGPRFDGGSGMARYQDVVELVSDDERTLRSRVLGDDGTWHEFMMVRYRRRS